MAPRPTRPLRAARAAAAGRTTVGPATGAARPASRRPRRGLVVVGAVALLVGCGSTHGAGRSPDDPTTVPADPTPGPTLALAAGSSVVGLPDGLAAPPAEAVAGAARTPDDALIYVITSGSGTCPSIAGPRATDRGDGTVAVTFTEPEDGPCTRDRVPATTVVALPDGVAPDSDLVVAIGDVGVVTLPAGSAAPAWVGAGG